MRIDNIYQQIRLRPYAIQRPAGQLRSQSQPQNSQQLEITDLAERNGLQKPSDVNGLFDKHLIQLAGLIHDNNHHKGKFFGIDLRLENYKSIASNTNHTATNHQTSFTIKA